MRIVAVQRSAHAGEELHVPDGAASLPWLSVMESLDRHDVPDGLPFIVEDDGSLTGCDRLNTYLLASDRGTRYIEVKGSRSPEPCIRDARGRGSFRDDYWLSMDGLEQIAAARVHLSNRG